MPDKSQKIDASEWTQQDWTELYQAIDRVKKNVKARHSGEPAQSPGSGEALRTIHDKLIAASKSLHAVAVGAAAGYPPEGYDELTGKPLRIADQCWYDGMKAMETAVVNWLYDEANSAQPATPPLPSGEKQFTEDRPLSLNEQWENGPRLVREGDGSLIRLAHSWDEYAAQTNTAVASSVARRCANELRAALAQPPSVKIGDGKDGEQV